MAGHVLLPRSSKDESNSTSHPPLLPPPSPRSHLRIAPVVSSSFCCPRRRPPPVPPRPNLSVSANADAAADDLSRARETPAYLWRKDEKWHPVSYEGFSAATADAAAASAPSSTPRPRRNRRRTPKKKPPRNPKPPSRMFSSDDDDDDQDDDDEEDEMLVSSTTDNSFEMTELRLRRTAMMEGAKSADSRTSSPWRRLSPCLGGEGDSLAVVKQSEDPRSDFRRSMAEMVVEKGIYEARDLEQLLHCFLSLNSQHHHQAIVDAFTDVWVALFPATPFNRSPGQGNPPLLPIGIEEE